ncbi:similar to Saccharomyces cerevisiae YDR424C DYN2 Cytoplasmic light chain dynein [Geotrichum candidum]|uniref:Dynein light chain n=1 Tax=Geotrichum candidum TaxID=1173061 RepID=A0A0J9X4N6_GEOCN|nr:similar to Saccharomyces cerevisiae YDR424C DYN2 Cytoplasmic light chain dynein [Geotrichum candidum]
MSSFNEPKKDLTPIVKSVDMSEEMQTVVLELAQTAVTKYTLEKDMAGFLKKELDKLYGLNWHAVVGEKFGSYVTHETKHFIYLCIGRTAILLFKTA